MEAPHRIVFLAYEGVALLDLAGPQSAFRVADQRMRDRYRQAYQSQTASLAGGIVRTAEGIELSTIAVSTLSLDSIDTIIVPGSPAMPRFHLQLERLTEWLCQASLHARRTVAICSGAFLLAQAGLLNGKRAATHWALCDLLQKRFPLIEVEREAIFVRQHSLWTSAGCTASIDLAIALVEEDCGRDVAMQVARDLVLFVRRPGEQSQVSELLRMQMQTEDDEPFSHLHLWIQDNLEYAPLSVEIMAQKVHMSPRNFARIYKQKTGLTPARAVQKLRIEAAQRMLQSSARSVAHIARSCGFGNEERLRTAFHRTLGVAPRDYRKRMAANDQSSRR